MESGSGRMHHILSDNHIFQHMWAEGLLIDTVMYHVTETTPVSSEVKMLSGEVTWIMSMPN